MPKLPEAEGIAGCCATSPEAPPFQLITIGESTIAGVGVRTHEEGFTGALARAIAEGKGVNVQWKVYAKSGYTAKKVRTSLVPAITERSADLIVIGLGANDAFTLQSPAKWQRDISALIAALQSRFADTPILFANMPPIKGFPAFPPLIKFVVGNLVEILGDALSETVAPLDQVDYYSRKISLSDWAERLGIVADTTDFFSDGVHPSKLTYQTWGKDLAAYWLGLELSRRTS